MPLCVYTDSPEEEGSQEFVNLTGYDISVATHGTEDTRTEWLVFSRGHHLNLYRTPSSTSMTMLINELPIDVYCMELTKTKRESVFERYRRKDPKLQPFFIVLPRHVSLVPDYIQTDVFTPTQSPNNFRGSIQCHYLERIARKRHPTLNPITQKDGLPTPEMMAKEDRPKPAEDQKQEIKSGFVNRTGYDIKRNAIFPSDRTMFYLEADGVAMFTRYPEAMVESELCFLGGRIRVCCRGAGIASGFDGYADVDPEEQPFFVVLPGEADSVPKYIVTDVFEPYSYSIFCDTMHVTSLKRFPRKRHALLRTESARSIMELEARKTRRSERLREKIVVGKLKAGK